jgi:hypothetical protein
MRAPLAVVFEYAHENVPTAEGPRIGRLAHWFVEHPATSVVLQARRLPREEDESGSASVEPATSRTRFAGRAPTAAE